MLEISGSDLGGDDDDDTSESGARTSPLRALGGGASRRRTLGGLRPRLGAPPTNLPGGHDTRPPPPTHPPRWAPKPAVRIPLTPHADMESDMDEEGLGPEEEAELAAAEEAVRAGGRV